MKLIINIYLRQEINYKQLKTVMILQQLSNFLQNSHNQKIACFTNYQINKYHQKLIIQQQKSWWYTFIKQINNIITNCSTQNTIINRIQLIQTNVINAFQNVLQKLYTEDQIQQAKKFAYDSQQDDQMQIQESTLIQYKLDQAQSSLIQKQNIQLKQTINQLKQNQQKLQEQNTSLLERLVVILETSLKIITKIESTHRKLSEYEWIITQCHKKIQQQLQTKQALYSFCQDKLNQLENYRNKLTYQVKILKELQQNRLINKNRKHAHNFEGVMQKIKSIKLLITKKENCNQQNISQNIQKFD